MKTLIKNTRAYSTVANIGESHAILSAQYEEDGQTLNHDVGSIQLYPLSTIKVGDMVEVECDIIYTRDSQNEDGEIQLRNIKAVGVIRAEYAKSVSIINEQFVVDLIKMRRQDIMNQELVESGKAVIVIQGLDAVHDFSFEGDITDEDVFANTNEYLFKTESEAESFLLAMEDMKLTYTKVISDAEEIKTIFEQLDKTRKPSI